jgi:membrane dipeptidase
MPLTRRQFLQLTALASAAGILPGQGNHARAQTDAAPIIVDGHLDLGGNIVNLKRDYTQSAYTLRDQSMVGGQAMIGLPELLAGRVALCIGAMHVYPASRVSPNMQAYVPARYDTPAEAEAWGWIELEAIEALAASSDRFRIVINQNEIDGVLASWETDQPEESRQIGIILGMEGADPIRDPAALEGWYDRGLRHVGLAWDNTRYAGGSMIGGGLTDLGIELLAEMRRSGMLLDVAHLSETAFWQALEHWDGPVVYSHGIVRYYFPYERALGDDQVRALAERGGLVGIAAYSGFFEQNRRGVVPTLDDLVDAIEYVCDLTGSCDHVGIVSDADGGFGAEMAPIDTVADLQRIPVLLADRGYGAAEIDAIMHGNWLRIWREVLA